MSSNHEALADFLQAVTEKTVQLSSVHANIRAVADDVRRSLLTAVPVESREQKEYREQFGAWLKNPAGEKSRMSECAAELAQKDFTITGTGPGGGFAAPKELASRIAQQAYTRNPWLEPDILGPTEVTTNDYHAPVGLSDSQSSRALETTDRTGLVTGVATLRDCKPTWGEYTARVKISNWAREDIVDLEDFLTREIGKQIGRDLANDIVTGDGNAGKVLGLLNTTPVTTADSASPIRAATALQYTFLAGANVALPDIEGLLGAFAEEYLLDPSFRIMMRPKTWFTLAGAPRTGTSASTEAPFLIPAAPLVYGYPVEMTSAVAAIGTNSYSILAGAWKRGLLLVTRGPALLTIDEVSILGYAIYRFRVRYGACIRDNNAIKVLKFGTS